MTDQEKLIKCRDALDAVWQLSLVIESSVRHMEAGLPDYYPPGNHPKIMDMISKVKEARIMCNEP